MIPRGLFLLAQGKQAGLGEFGADTNAFTASLAPLIAFPLVGAGLSAYNGEWQLALVSFLSRLCAVLVLPVIVHEFARRAGREPLWLRTATALDWSFWMVIPLLFIAAFFGALGVEAGLPMQSAGYGALAFICGYLLWMHWFILRAGLQISRLAAFMLMLGISAAILVLTAAPFLVALAVTGQAMPV